MEVKMPTGSEFVFVRL